MDSNSRQHPGSQPHNDLAHILFRQGQSDIGHIIDLFLSALEGNLMADRFRGKANGPTIPMNAVERLVGDGHAPCPPDLTPSSDDTKTLPIRPREARRLKVLPPIGQFGAQNPPSLSHSTVVVCDAARDIIRMGGHKAFGTSPFSRLQYRAVI